MTKIFDLMRPRSLAVAMLTIAGAALLPGMLALSGCGDGGGGYVGGGKHVIPPVKVFGVVVVADDGSGFTDGMQVIQIADSNGKILPTPNQQYFPIANAWDLDGQSITPDGTHGAAVDGGNLVHFFTADLANGTITLSPNTIDVSTYGGDGDSIASLPNGDEVIVSAGGYAKLAHISGILSDNPVIAEDVPTSNLGGEYDGLVISEDGKVMLSRESYGNVLDVYSINKVAPHAGALGGTISFDFTLAKTLTNFPSAESADGRAGLAISPVNSSRAVVTGSDKSVNLITGLPDNPTITDSLILAENASAVSISRDGKYAVIATDAGLVVVTGVTGSKLSVVGNPYSPTFNVPGGTCTLNSPETLGITYDGKHVSVIQDCNLTETATEVGSGVLLTVPFSQGKLGDPVGQLNNVVTPSNDQLLIH